jgi:hypothetical protein
MITFRLQKMNKKMNIQMTKGNIQNAFHFSTQTTQIRKIFADNLCSSFQSVLSVCLFKREDERTKGTNKNLFTRPLVYSSTKAEIQFKF